MLIAAGTAGLLGWTAWSYLGPGPRSAQDAATDVVLTSGGGLKGVAVALGEAHVVGSPAEFMVAALVTGSAHRLKAGEYEFRSGESLAEVLTAIRRGEVVRHQVTIPEGFTSREAVSVLNRVDYLDGAVTVPPEGALLPETYEVRRGETRAAVMRRMMDAREKVLEPLWRSRSPGLPLANPEQAVVLASVVEKETARPDERPRIASVFVNRLRKGMRLESDPTVIYAVSGGAPLGHGLRVSELALRSPYNTYLFGGLPPTPIANPGRAALAAVLRPAPTDDLFFVADGAGGHVFAATFEAHKRNVARWRSVEAARGAEKAP